MTAIEAMAAYRLKLLANGRMLEARAVERCIKITKDKKQEKDNAIKNLEVLLLKRKMIDNQDTPRLFIGP